MGYTWQRCTRNTLGMCSYHKDDSTIYECIGYDRCDSYVLDNQSKKRQGTRIDIIGQNGNSGEHYDKEDK